MARIFLTTYKIANEHGAACGEWIDVGTDDIDEALGRIGARYGDPTHEEPMIADHEGWSGIDPLAFPIGDLEAVAELIDDRGDDIAAIIACTGAGYYSSADDLRDAVESASITWGDSERDAAEQLAEDLGAFEDVPEHLRYYIDVDAWFEGECNDMHSVQVGRRVALVSLP